LHYSKRKINFYGKFFLEMAPAHPDIRSDSDIRSRFQRNQTSASAGGYPLATVGHKLQLTSQLTKVTE
jgi:hypothetical protein